MTQPMQYFRNYNDDDDGNKWWEFLMCCPGHVYGERALEAQARQNEGQVICPRTKEIYSFKDAEKVYIM